MSPQETPTSESEQPTPSEAIYMERASEIQATLELGGVRDWKQWLERVNAAPTEPTEAKVGPVLRAELDQQYKHLIEKRELVILGLASILIYIDNKAEITPLEGNATRRNLAEYLYRLNKYENLMRGPGTIDADPGVPEQLAPYLAPDEEQQLVLRASEVLLRMQYDVLEDQGEGPSPRKLFPLSRELALSARNISMKTVLACLNGEDKLLIPDRPYEEFIRIAGYESLSAEDVRAARLLIGYIGKNLPTIREYVEFSGKKSIDDLTVVEALECCTGMQALGEVTREIAHGVQGMAVGIYPDLRSFVNRTLEDNSLYPPRMVQMALSPLAELSPDASVEDREQRQRDLQAVAIFLIGFSPERGRVSNVEIHLKNVHSESQKEMVRALCREVRSGALMRPLLRASLVPRDEEDRTKEERQAVAALEDIMHEGRLSLRDAFEIYYLSNTQGGDLPLAFKAVHLLEEHGHTDIAGDFQDSRFAKITKMALSSVTGLADDFEMLGFTDAQQREFRNVRMYLREAGLESAVKLMNMIINFHKYYPWYVVVPVDVVTVSGPAAAGTGILFAGRRVYIKYNVTALERFAAKGPAALREQFGLTQLADDQIKAAQQEVIGILNEYDRLVNRWHFFRGRALVPRANMYIRAAETGELSDMAAALKLHYPHPEDVASHLKGIAPDYDSIREAMRTAGFTTSQIDTGIDGIRFPGLKKEATEMFEELQRIAKLPGPERIEPTKALQQRSRIFRDAVNELSETMPEARRLFAQHILNLSSDMELTELSDKLWKALQKAHTVDGLDAKWDIFRQAHLTDEELEIADRFIRLGLAGETPVEIAEEATELGARLSRISPQLAESQRLTDLLRRNAGLIEALEQAEEALPNRGAAHAAEYLLNLSDDAGDAAREAEVVLRAAQAAQSPADAQVIAQQISRAAEAGRLTPQSAIGVIDDLSRIRKLSVGARALAGISLVTEIGFVGLDVYMRHLAKQEYEMKMENITGALDELVLQGLLKKDGETYVGPGMEINIRTFENAQVTDVESWTAHTAVDAAGAASSVGLLFVSSSVAGPAGLAIAGGIITVKTGIELTRWSIDQHRRTELLRKAPLWLKVTLGSQLLTGRTNREIIDEHEGMMVSQFGPRSWKEAAAMVYLPQYAQYRLAGGFLASSEQEGIKNRIQDEELMQMGYLTLMREHPELLPELPGYGQPQEFLGPDAEFIAEDGDFERIVRPFIIIQLQAAQKTKRRGPNGKETPIGQTFKQTDTLDLQHSGDAVADFLWMPDTSEWFYNSPEAARRAMLLYVHHLRLKRYWEAARAIDDNENYDRPLKEFFVAGLNEQVEKNKSAMYVLNVHPKTLMPDAIERLVQERYAALKEIDDTVHESTALAKQGFRLESGRGETSLDDFIESHLEIQHRAAIEARLREYSETHPSLPYSFSELESWGTDEEFGATFAEITKPVADVDQLLMHLTLYSSEEALKAVVESKAHLFEEYLQFASHRDFYERYSTHWRRADHVPGFACANVRLLREWKEAGYPTLIDEENIAHLASGKPEDLQLLFDLPSVSIGEETGRVVRLKPERRGTSSLPGSPRDPLTAAVEKMREDEASRRALEDRLHEEGTLVASGNRLVPLTEFQGKKNRIVLPAGRLGELKSFAKNDGFDRLREALLARRVLVGVGVR